MRTASLVLKFSWWTHSKPYVLRSSTAEQYIPKEVTKCSCALRVFMHRLFLKSQTRRVLSSAQLKINFPPEWNRTPRTQLSWPTLCTRRNQWADAGFKAKQPTADATANGATPRPAPARTAFSFPRPIRTQSLSAVSIITSISALPTRRVPVLEAPNQPPKCDPHRCCPPSASPETKFQWLSATHLKHHTTALLHLHYEFSDY